MNLIHKLRDIRIGTRLAVGFGTLLAVMALIVIGGNFLQQRSITLLAEALQVANQKEVMGTVMKSALLEAALAMRNIGLQTDVAGTQREKFKLEEQRRKYELARGQLVAAGLSEAENAIITNITKLDQQMEGPLEQTVAQGLMFNQEAAAKILNKTIAPLSQQVVSEINQLVKIQQISVNDSLSQILASSDNLKALLYLVGLMGLAFGIAWAWLLTRSITQPLHRAVAIARRVAAGDLSSRESVLGTDELSQLLRALDEMTQALTATVGKVRGGAEAVDVAAREIATANADLSSRTDSQASFLEETAGSMEELTSTVTHSADQARHANQLVVSASDIATKGGQVVANVVTTMDVIKASSSRIQDVIGVIDGIAFQTNILALNAAVEAARAGEHGRGFGVVAAEVRNLAQRSAAAAKETKELIYKSVENIDTGSALVIDAGRTMDQIVTSVKQVVDIIAEITQASIEQRSGIEQVNAAIGQMDSMTQQNAAMVEEAAATANNLQQYAVELRKAISVFVIEQARPATVVVADRERRYPQASEAPAPRVRMIKK